jgi:glutamate-1-semialdehyde 2,1-aminomutase
MQMDYRERLKKVIPAGCHTYSRGADQFPSNAPQILSRGSGPYVCAPDNKSYLDYGMGLRAVTCGYHEPSITMAAMDGAMAGNCLTMPSTVELQAAELACDILGFDMVKFTKNGSTATTAAVKLAKAATGRKLVLCAKQPFFSYDDWFIATTKRDKGAECDNTDIFNNIRHLKNEFDLEKYACIVLEPKDHDLKAIRDLCDKHGTILIFDEMITGFRYHGWSKAAHDGVKPDLSCFGKGMANGFSVACVGGKREIMEIGAQRDVFLASSTHGAEMSGLAAFIETVRFYERNGVSGYIADYERAIQEILPKTPPEKTLFMQEMCKRGVLMPYVSPSYRHGEIEFKLTKRAIEGSMEAIDKGAVLEGPEIVPVFS